jgi:urease accessory protein
MAILMPTDAMTDSSAALLYLLQLASPALPIGAYSYSEGVEYLSQTQQITSADELAIWLTGELKHGSIRLEAQILYEAYQCSVGGKFELLYQLNTRLSALRDTEELRQQSWQMGRALVRLLNDIQPELQPSLSYCGEPCNVAIAFAVAAAYWQITPRSSLLGYLHSWANNLITAGIRLIPLGQTAGQRILLQLYPQLQHTTDEVLATSALPWGVCNWGAAIASMNHETLYSRLFRS